MASRTFRLSISPESSPEVKRVLELDGRASLHELHVEIGKAFGLPPSGAVYAFFLSGRFWDASTAYVDPRAEGQRANKALLFRLGLTPQKTFAYLLGFEVERHFLVQVVSVIEAEQALPEPKLVEAVGDAPPELSLTETAPSDADADRPPEEIATFALLAEEFLDADDELEPYEDDLAAARLRDAPWDTDSPELGNLERFRARPDEPDLEPLREVMSLFRTAHAAGLRFAQALDGSANRFIAVDDWLIERGLGPRLLDFPMSLSIIGEHDLALELGRALSFIDPDLMNGDVAVILAKAGRREQALAQLKQNLEQARDRALVESKAGDTYRALGDLPAAEAYYRRSLVEAKSASDRLHALLRLIGCLTDSGRDAEATALLQEARKARGEPNPAVDVGRNDPCPCGSGKKYKKCHGT